MRTVIDGIEYQIEETETETILRPLERDEFGFFCTLIFSKDENKDAIARESLYNFFAREIV